MTVQEIDKFDVKLDVIPKGLEEYVAVTNDKKLVFIDSMQLMHSSFEELVKNLSDNDLKYLSQEFSGEHLKLVKQKGIYPFEYMDSFLKAF